MTAQSEIIDWYKTDWDCEALRAVGKVVHVCQICFASDFRPFIFARPMTNNEGIT